MPDDDDDTTSMREAARILDMPQSTVQLWCQLGVIESEELPSGKRKIKRESLMLMKHGLQNANFRIEADGAKMAVHMIEKAFARWRIDGSINALCRDVMAVQRTIETLKRHRRGAA